MGKMQMIKKGDKQALVMYFRKIKNGTIILERYENILILAMFIMNFIKKNDKYF